nr:MAG TPA: hypothetical protein [Caudoviricetes sp.]
MNGKCLIIINFTPAIAKKYTIRQQILISNEEIK